jgi:hypothetical protein
MDRLIELLKEIDADVSLSDRNTDAVISHPNAIEIESLANDVLIADDGTAGCNWLNIEHLKSLGWPVFPLERDRFGWLIGGIQTKKGVIAYG